jgi:hypothetical protein
MVKTNKLLPSSAQAPALAKLGMDKNIIADKREVYYCWLESRIA